VAFLLARKIAASQFTILGEHNSEFLTSFCDLRSVKPDSCQFYDIYFAMAGPQAFRLLLESMPPDKLRGIT